MKYQPTKTFLEQPSLFSVFNDSINSIIDSSLDSYKFRTTVEEGDNAYVVTAQVPGLNKDDISIKIEDGTILVEGSRQVTKGMESSIHREFNIGRDIDELNASAEVKDGILTLTLPKKEKKKVKTIKIK